jgi:hypothetical protein
MYPHAGELRFNENGEMLIGNYQPSADFPGWHVFNWNNQFDVWAAYARQRYGASFNVSGCQTPAELGPAYITAWYNIFGRSMNCTELFDQFYNSIALSGLTGDLAEYNGLDIMDASLKKYMEYTYLVPGPGYIGTPGSPGPYWKYFTNSKTEWLKFYNNAVRFGLQAKLPFTLADINAAFP